MVYRGWLVNRCWVVYWGWLMDWSWVVNWGWCWNRLRLRLAHHRLRQEPWSQAAAVLLRHPGIRPLRGYGTFLSHDGLPAPLCLLRRWRKSWTPLYIIVARSF